MRKDHICKMPTKAKSKILFVDVETPNGHNDSICSIGAVLTDMDGNVLDEQYSLVNPEAEFWGRNMRIHGITEDDVKSAPTFKELWKEKLANLFKSARIVAHNNSFDMNVIAKTFKTYDIEVDDAYVAEAKGGVLYGTDEERRRKLGINDYNIHNALWDARYAKAEFFYNWGGEHVNDAPPYGFWEKYDFKTRKFKRFSEYSGRWI